MFLRKVWREKDGKRHQYWALAETIRTARGPRQHIVAWLGELDEPKRQRWHALAHELDGDRAEQLAFFEDDGSPTPSLVQVQTRKVRLERTRDFGAVFLAWTLWRKLGLDQVLMDLLPPGREAVPWAQVAALLTVARFCEPASELHIEANWYGRSAAEDLLGISAAQVNTDRLYRTLDLLLPHKVSLERHLKTRLGELFPITWDLLLYDVTSTYVEGRAEANPLAARGYSRDSRPDCLQVCLGLVVTTDGLPLGYEVFAGNRADVTTLEDMVKAMEAKYGHARRIWVLDRGLVDEDNLAFLRARGAQYVVGTPRPMLRRFEYALLDQGWAEVQPGVEVKSCPSPTGTETFVLCRRADRRLKEQAIHHRFTVRLETALTKLRDRLARARHRVNADRVNRQIGRLLALNSRAAGAFEITLSPDPTCPAGHRLIWQQRAEWAQWAALSEGCYLLRTNLPDTTPTELWRMYIQLTDAEAAFRTLKSDLHLRPLYHQSGERVQAHILVAFLAYVLRRTLAMWMKGTGLGSAPQVLIDELKRLKSGDVVLPTAEGRNVRIRCVATPDKAQRLLLEHLGLSLPRRLRPLAEIKERMAAPG